ncbi:MAG: Thiol peroxidase [Chlamydiales bacterium]|nr:Thiol peroxidase [Chlamydiales bacterium]
MSQEITLKGKEVHLIGELPKQGQQVPDCELIGSDLKPVKISSFKGKPLLILAVPSLDTEVCSRETKQFSEQINQFGDGLQTLCISMDLPFAQSRFCGAESIKNILTLSDYRNRDFGKTFGVLIDEIKLLARSVFLIDSEFKMHTVHLVKEVSEEPDYSLILEAVKKLLSK